MSTRTPRRPRPTLAEQEAMADIRRTSSPGAASATVRNALTRNRWALWRGTHWWLTDAGEAALNEAARRYDGLDAYDPRRYGTAFRARRYDQCDDTCTVDCGHCKGQGRPAL